jgi:hypothetical protein
MNRISTRIASLLSVLSLAVVMTLGAFSQTAYAQDTLSKTQLNALIATAKTPAEHQRIAYQQEATRFLAQADEHKAMIAAYKANPSTKHQASESRTAQISSPASTAWPRSRPKWPSCTSRWRPKPAPGTSSRHRKRTG